MGDKILVAVLAAIIIAGILGSRKWFVEKWRSRRQDDALRLIALPETLQWREDLDAGGTPTRHAFGEWQMTSVKGQTTGIAGTFLDVFGTKYEGSVTVFAEKKTSRSTTNYTPGSEYAVGPQGQSMTIRFQANYRGVVSSGAQDALSAVVSFVDGLGNEYRGRHTFLFDSEQ